MSGRFAGAERLGDRRRRRLAVHGETPTSAAANGDDQPGDAGAEGTEGRRLRIDLPEVAAPPQAPALPLDALVPLKWWKQLLATVFVAALIGGIEYAAWRAEDVAVAAGPGVWRLIEPEHALLPTTMGAGLLLVAAQLSGLIAWGRSRSARDFSGRYRLWYRVGTCCALFSLTTATAAHRALVETIVHFFPREVWRRETVLWLAPTAVVAAACGSALRWEVAKTKVGTALLWTATLLYICSAALQLELDGRLPADLRTIAVSTSLLLGHLFLAACFWAHCRIVLYFSADPIDIPRGARRPFFLFGRRSPAQTQSAADGDEEDTGPEEAGRRPRKRRKKPKRATPRRPIVVEAAAESETSSPNESPAETAPVDSNSDSDLDSDSDGTDVADEASPRPQHAAAPSHSPLAAESAPAVSDDEQEWLTLSQAAEQSAKPMVASPRRDARPTAAATDDEQSADDREGGRHSESETGEEEESHGGPHISFKGLSKKQRRKLQQEMRERERRIQRG